MTSTTKKEGGAWVTRIRRDGVLLKEIVSYGGSRREAEKEARVEMRRMEGER